MTTKQAKVGKQIIVKEESGSIYSGEVLKIHSVSNGFANLTRNNKVQILNMPIKYLR